MKSSSWKYPVFLISFTLGISLHASDSRSFQIYPTYLDPSYLYFQSSEPLQKDNKPTSCQRAWIMLDLIIERHYRGFSDMKGFREQMRQALIDSFDWLKLPEGMTPEKAREVLKTAEEKAGNLYYPVRLSERPGGFGLDCRLPKQGISVWANLSKTEKRVPKIFSDQEVFDALINALLFKMDPHSGILVGSDFQDFNEIGTGERSGVGFEVQRRDNKLWVSFIYEDSPASESEIKTGDELVAFYDNRNRQLVSPMDDTKIRQMLKGEEGKVVNLEIQKPDSDELILLSLKMKKFKLTFVKSNELPNQILEIKIFDFGRGVADDVERIIKDRLASPKEKMRAIIVDVRTNLGGIPNESANLVDHFIDQGLVFSFRDRKGHLVEDVEELSKTEYFAETPGELTDVPMIVRINEYSASCSELFSQGILDYGRGITIGRPSYGKVTVTSSYLFPENRMLNLTQYLAFSRYQSLHYKGVEALVSAPDPLMEFISNMGFRISRYQHHENAIAPPPPLNRFQQDLVGQFDPPNPIREILRLLPPETFELSEEMSEEIPDDGLRLAWQVADAWADLCPSYRIESCRPLTPISASKQ